MPISRAFRRAVEQVLYGASAWHDWVPGFTQGTAVNVTAHEARYCLVGKVCHIYAHLTLTSAGTAGNWMALFGIPAAARPAYYNWLFAAGSFVYFDNDTGYRAGAAVINSAGWFTFLCGDGSWMGDRETAANGDEIGFSATYRVA